MTRSSRSSPRPWRPRGRARGASSSSRERPGAARARCWPQRRDRPAARARACSPRAGASSSASSPSAPSAVSSSRRCARRPSPIARRSWRGLPRPARGRWTPTGTRRGRGRTRRSPCFTASTGSRATSPNAPRCCSWWTTCTGPTRRPCARWRISRPGSATSRSPSSSRCGRTSRARRTSCWTRSSPSRTPCGSACALCTRSRSRRSCAGRCPVPATRCAQRARARARATPSSSASCCGPCSATPTAATRSTRCAAPRSRTSGIASCVASRGWGPRPSCSRARWPSSTAAASPTPRRSRASTMRGPRRSRTA